MVHLVFTGALFALVLVALGFNGPAKAQDYPSKNVTIVVTIGAGTGMDVLRGPMPRIVQAVLGKPVVVENKPGSAGPWLAALKGTPARTGYTLMVATSDHGDQPVAAQADPLRCRKRISCRSRST